MKTEFTPGPWTTGRAINTVDMGRYSFICPYGANGADQVKEITANARLIAAAPDLYDALYAIQQAGNIWPDLQLQVDSAIAKATGHD